MSTPASTEKLTLFMAEDEEDTAALLKFLLGRAGYEIVHAADGLQAMQMIDTMAPPNMVLLDIMLPHISGLQLLPHIRSKADWQRVPVVMLTADSMQRDIQQAIAAGATDYLVKPFNPRELTTRINRCLLKAAS